MVNMLTETRERMEEQMRGAPRQLRRDRLNFVRAARLFKFDREASALLGRVRESLRNSMIEHEQFAIPPYPATMLQLDYRAYCLAQPMAENINRGVDEHVAYMLADAGDRHDLRVAVLTYDPERGPQPLPFCFERNTRDDPRVRSLLARASLLMQEHMLRQPDAADHRDAISRFGERDMRRVILGGTHSIDLRAGEGEEMTTASLDHWGIRVWGDDAFQITDAPTWVQMLIEQRGDLAIALSALLLLNRPKRDVVETVEVPTGIEVSSGRLKPYEAYHTVRLSVAPKIAERRLRRSAHGWRNRAHQVAGFFQHRPARLKMNACEHEWEQLDERRWRCKRCPLHRTWIPHQECRGDASLGWVHKDYEVTT